MPPEQIGAFPVDQLLNKLVASGLSVHVVDNGDFTHRATARVATKDGARGWTGQGKDACEAIERALQAAVASGAIKEGKPADQAPPPPPKP